MRRTGLGRLYPPGEVIFHEGDPGACMYLVQKGALDVVLEEQGGRVVNSLSSGEFFGEMSLLSGEPRSATIRCRDESRVMTIDERAFMRRMREDPLLAFRVLEKLCARLRARGVADMDAREGVTPGENDVSKQ